MYVGIDIGGTKCAVVLGDGSGNVINKIRFETTNKDDTIRKIVEAVETLGDFKSIGISCGGPLDEKEGVILSPPNLPGWDNIRIVDMLKDRFHVPVKIMNDANACAMAEWRFGAGIGSENMIFLTFGTGLGAGIIINGKLYSGANGFAGEVGHIRLSDNGPAGYGKCGSFEGFCSGSGLRELGRSLAREYIQRGITPTFISNSSLDAFSVAEMANAARSGDACAIETFDFCGKMLGRGLAILCDILNPDTVVIGSVYQRCHDLLSSPAIEWFEREALPSVSAHVKIVPALLGDRIGDVAALAVAMST